MSTNLELNELSGVSEDENTSILREASVNMDDKKSATAEELEPVYDIPVKVSAVLGKTKMTVSQLMKLNKGTIIELDKKVGEPVDIYVNNNLVAKGEVVIVDNKLGVTMSEIIKTVK